MIIDDIKVRGHIKVWEHRAGKKKLIVDKDNLVTDEGKLALLNYLVSQARVALSMGLNALVVTSYPEEATTAVTDTYNNRVVGKILHTIPIDDPLDPPSKALSTVSSGALSIEGVLHEDDGNSGGDITNLQLCFVDIDDIEDSIKSKLFARVQIGPLVKSDTVGYTFLWEIQLLAGLSSNSILYKG